MHTGDRETMQRLKRHRRRTTGLCAASCSVAVSWMFLVSPAFAEEPLTLSFVSRADHSDPYGLTFRVEGPGVEALTDEHVDAAWLPASSPGDVPNETADLAAYAAGKTFVHTDYGHFLHIRRAPGKPAKPDSGLLIRIQPPQGEALYIRPKLPDDLKQKQVDVMLLIDESLSMKRNDKERLRVAAAKVFADLASGGGRIGRIGIVAFNNNSRLLLPLTETSLKDAIFTAADKIRNGGETDLDGAIELAAEQFSKVQGSEKVAILLTDGKDQPGVYEDAHRIFAEKKWLMHAIGLSKKADHETLQRIAKDTGGKYHDAPNSEQLQGIFGEICFSLQNRTLIRRSTVHLTPGPARRTTYAFDPSLTHVALTMKAQIDEDAAKNLVSDHTMTSPETADAPIAAKGTGVWRYFDFWTPKPGNWSLSSSSNVPAETVFEATAITDLNLWHFPVPVSYEWGEPVSLHAGIALENSFLTTASLDAEIRYPDGSMKSHRYESNGNTYRLTLPDQLPTGDYRVLLRATGQNGDGPFERELRTAFRIEQTKPPRLWLTTTSLDFGQLWPGENRSESFKAKVITAEVLKSHPIKVLESRLTTDGDVAFAPDGITFSTVGTKPPGGLLTSSRELTTHNIALRIPAGQQPGVYQGLIVLQHSLPVGEFEAAAKPSLISVRVEVMSTQLVAAPPAIDYGTIQTGQTRRTSIALSLTPRGNVPLSVKLVRPETRIERAVELPDGVVVRRDVVLPVSHPESLTTEKVTIPLSMEIGRHASPGTRRWNLVLKAGRHEQEIPVRFELQWPAFTVQEQAIDFGRVYCGQTVEETIHLEHNSMHSEVVQVLGMDSESAEKAHLNGETAFRVDAVGSETATGTREIQFRLSPPENAVPGEYSGRLMMKTWFGQTEIPWKAKLDVAEGFFVSTPLLAFPEVRPGNEHTMEVTVQSTIERQQSVSLRAQFARLPEGLQIEASPSRISLGPKRSARVKVTLTADEGVPAGSVSQRFQLRGPYNSESLQVRAEVVPKRVEIIERPFELTLVEPMPDPPAPPPGSFNVFPPDIDLTDVFPGDTLFFEVEVEGDFPQSISVSVGDHDALALEAIVPAIEMGHDDSQIQSFLLRVPHGLDGGLQYTEIAFTNGTQAQTVPVTVSIRLPEPEVIETPVIEEVVQQIPLTPAPEASRIMLPNWLRNLLWILLLLLAAVLLVAALKWIFSIDVPEMTKFYLASGIVHVMFALLGAVYFLESKVIEVEQPKKLNVHLVEKQQTDEQQVMEESEPIESLDQKPIEVQKEETETEPEAQDTQETSQSKTTAENQAESQDAQEVEVEKKTEESEAELAAAQSESEKQNSAEQAKLSEPQMEVVVQQSETTESEKSEESAAAEREVEKSERERVREQERPEESQAAEVSPEKQEQPEETEIVEARSEEAPASEVRPTETVETEAQPTEQKLAETATDEPKVATEVEVARAESQAKSEKATVDTTRPTKAEPVEVEVEKSDTEPSNPNVKATSAAARAETDLQSESVSVEVVSDSRKADSQQSDVTENSTAMKRESSKTEQTKSAQAAEQSAESATEVSLSKSDVPTEVEVKEAASGAASPSSQSQTVPAVSAETPSVDSKSSAEPSLSASEESGAASSKATSGAPASKTLTVASSLPAASTEVELNKSADQGAPSLSEATDTGVGSSKAGGGATAEAADIQSPSVSQVNSAAEASDIAAQTTSPAAASGNTGAVAGSKQLAPGKSASPDAAANTNSITELDQGSAPSLAGSASGQTGEAGGPSGEVSVEAASISASGSVQKMNGTPGATTITVGQASLDGTTAASTAHGRTSATNPDVTGSSPGDTATDLKPASDGAPGVQLTGPRADKSRSSGTSAMIERETASGQPTATVKISSEKASGTASGPSGASTAHGRSGATSAHSKSVSGSKSGEGLEPSDEPTQSLGTAGGPSVSLTSGPVSGAGGPSSPSEFVESTTVASPGIVVADSGNSSDSILDPVGGVATIRPLAGHSGTAEKQNNAARYLAGKNPLVSSSVLGPTRNSFQPGLFPAISTSGRGQGEGVRTEGIDESGVTSNPSLQVAHAAGSGIGVPASSTGLSRIRGGQQKETSRTKAPVGRTTLARTAVAMVPSNTGTASELAPKVLAQDDTVSEPGFSPVPGKQMTEFVTFLASFGEFAGRTGFKKRQVGAMSFLKDEVERRLSFILSSKVQVVPFSNRNQLMRAPWAFMTGEFAFEFSQREATNLRDYLEGGGWLWVDDCSAETDHTFDRSFHEQIRLVLPDAEYREIPMEHPLFTSCYSLEAGYEGYDVPPGDKYRENRLHAYFIDGRPAIIYTRNDYGCGLEIDPAKGTAGQKSQTDLSPEQMREGALRMSMNLVFYFLGERGVQVERTRIVEEAEQEMKRRKDHEERWRSLFTNGAIDHFEDFESDTAEEWTPSDWEGSDIPELSLIGGNGQMKLDVRFKNEHSKAAFERDLGEAEKLDLSNASAILVDVHNQSTAITRLALALSTGGQEYRYYESPQVVLKPGVNRNVLFHLGKNFKTAPKWEYNEALEGANDVRKLTFIVYPIKPGRLVVDNLRVSTVRREDIADWLRSEMENNRTNNVK